MSSRKALAETLKKFEHPPEIPDAIERQEDSENQATFRNDMRRLQPSIHLCTKPKSSFVCKFHIYVIQTAFKDFFQLKLPYLQGMPEIALVISDTYFSDIITQSRKGVSVEESEGPIGPESISKKEEQLFQEIIAANEKVFSKFENSLINVLVEKYIPLFINNFEKYTKLSKVFEEMMKKHFNWKFKHESVNNNLTYMTEVFTFFGRAVANSEASAKLFNLVLNGDSSIIFGILGVYLERIDIMKRSKGEEDQKSHQIEDVDDKDIAQIVKMQELFIKCCNGTDESPKRGLKQSLLAIAVVGAAALAIGISCWKKSSDNN